MAYFVLCLAAPWGAMPGLQDWMVHSEQMLGHLQSGCAINGAQQQHHAVGARLVGCGGQPEGVGISLTPAQHLLYNERNIGTISAEAPEHSMALRYYVQAGGGGGGGVGEGDAERIGFSLMPAQHLLQSHNSKQTRKQGSNVMHCLKFGSIGRVWHGMHCSSLKV